MCVYRPAVLPCLMSLLWHHHVSMLWHLLLLLQTNCTKRCYAATRLCWDFVNVRFHKSENICALGWKECQTKGLCQTDEVILGQGNNGWFDSHNKTAFLCILTITACVVSSLAHFLHPAVLVSLWCLQPLSSWCGGCFFFLLTWSLTHLCLFSFNTADGNSYQVSISFFPSFISWLLYYQSVFAHWKGWSS